MRGRSHGRRPRPCSEPASGPLSGRPGCCGANRSKRPAGKPGSGPSTSRRSNESGSTPSSGTSTRADSSAPTPPIWGWTPTTSCPSTAGTSASPVRPCRRPAPGPVRGPRIPHPHWPAAVRNHASWAFLIGLALLAVGLFAATGFFRSRRPGRGGQPWGRRWPPPGCPDPRHRGHPGPRVGHGDRDGRRNLPGVSVQPGGGEILQGTAGSTSSWTGAASPGSP